MFLARLCFIDTCLFMDQIKQNTQLEDRVSNIFLAGLKKGEEKRKKRTESRAMCASWIMLSIALFTIVGLHKRLYLDLKSFSSSTCNVSFQTSTCASANAFKMLSSSQISLISRRSLVSGETSLKGFSVFPSSEGFFSSCSPFLPSSR